MIWLGLKLLGLKNFIVKHWKIIVPILLLIGAYFYHKHAVSSAYKEGVAAEYAYREGLAKVEKEKNRAVETSLNNQITNLLKLQSARDDKRIVLENASKETIVKILEQNHTLLEQCQVPQQIIDERNKIRRSLDVQ